MTSGTNASRGKILSALSFSTSTSTSFLSWPWATIIASLPVAVWIHDSFYSLCRVKGASMEPTLKSGDVILVRKSNWNPLFPPPKEDGIGKSTEEGKDGGSSKNGERFKRYRRRELDRQRMEQWERENCNVVIPPWALQSPPVPVRGDIVVYKDPNYYNTSWNVKRVIGLGGQVVMVPSHRFRHSPYQMDTNRKRNDSSNDMTSMRIATTSLAPYSLWVEGDNTPKSFDSKDHGPVTKKLLVGIAEYILWPPNRMGRLESDTSTTTRSDKNERSNNVPPKSYAYWP